MFGYNCCSHTSASATPTNQHPPVSTIGLPRSLVWSTEYGTYSNNILRMRRQKKVRESYVFSWFHMAAPSNRKKTSWPRDHQAVDETGKPRRVSSLFILHRACRSPSKKASQGQAAHQIEDRRGPSRT
ncbi:hypothetical protein TESG_06421 [Trichophyton tonsurans CBS 112818]|uniref:Uncharacterized protein n=1 Tax=Trichophyton tonsurans (strain CBS 112818) TaxID=647933 RepID=F2S665_TRIT1|nr:hypothetical protein TESG_06421 [Trichophyton tonsurans CBS 112818]